MIPSFKTAKHSKDRDYSGRQDKNYGKTNACRSFLTQYYGIRSSLELVNTCVNLPNNQLPFD